MVSRRVDATENRDASLQTAVRIQASGIVLVQIPRYLPIAGESDAPPERRTMCDAVLDHMKILVEVVWKYLWCDGTFLNALYTAKKPN